MGANPSDGTWDFGVASARGGLKNHRSWCEPSRSHLWRSSSRRLGYWAVTPGTRVQIPLIALQYIYRKCYGSTAGSNPARVGSIPTRCADGLTRPFDGRGRQLAGVALLASLLVAQPAGTWAKPPINLLSCWNWYTGRAENPGVERPVWVQLPPTRLHRPSIPAGSPVS